MVRMREWYGSGIAAFESFWFARAGLAAYLAHVEGRQVTAVDSSAGATPHCQRRFELHTVSPRASNLGRRKRAVHIRVGRVTARPNESSGRAPGGRQVSRAEQVA